MRSRRAGLWVFVVAALAVAGCSGGDDGSVIGTTTTTISEAAPAELADHPGDWVLPGHDYDNSRAASSSIDATNVRRLQVAWRHDLGGALSTVPLIVGDTVYVQDGSGAISALDRDTGVARWETEGTGFNIGPFGVAVADGRVFGVRGSKGVIALDAATGTEIWGRDVTDTPTAGIDIQPTVYDGLVFVSTVPISVGGIYVGGDRGIIQALDAATGETRWRFDTVASPDLWGNPEVNSGGGAWYPPAIDPERSLSYWGVANPAPFPGTPDFPNGSSRPGANLYTNSVVALDTATGELRWFDQVHPHDIFDRDLVHSLIARPAGRSEVVVGAGKGAVVVGIDPETGARMWTTPVGTHLNDDLEALSGPTEVAPGTFGGILTPPATADGVVYAAVVDAPVVLSPDETAYFGAELGVNDGQVVALDATDGTILWSVSVPGDPLGGVLVLNDMVVTATLDGRLVALDRSDGETVWQKEAPGGLNGWMSAAGDLLVVPVGNADPPQLVAYRLS